MELLVVVVLLTLMLSLLLPALSNARNAARQTACASNMRQIGTAVMMYANDHRGFAPPRWVDAVDPAHPSAFPGLPGYPAWGGSDGGLRGGAYAVFSDPAILGRYVSPDFTEVSGTILSRRSVFLCPADVKVDPGKSLWRGSFGMGPNFPTIRQADPYGRANFMLARLASPTTEMILVDSRGERFETGGNTFWGTLEPDPVQEWSGSGPHNAYNWSRRHKLGANVLFVDGHVTWYADLLQPFRSGELTLKGKN